MKTSASRSPHYGTRCSNRGRQPPGSDSETTDHSPDLLHTRGIRAKASKFNVVSPHDNREFLKRGAKRIKRPCRAGSPSPGSLRYAATDLSYSAIQTCHAVVVRLDRPDITASRLSNRSDRRLLGHRTFSDKSLDLSERLAPHHSTFLTHRQDVT